MFYPFPDVQVSRSKLVPMPSIHTDTRFTLDVRQVWSSGITCTHAQLVAVESFLGYRLALFPCTVWQSLVNSDHETVNGYSTDPHTRYIDDEDLCNIRQEHACFCWVEHAFGPSGSLAARQWNKYTVLYTLTC